MLYNKSFITEYVRYNSQDGKAEWTAAASKLSDEQKQQYLDYCIASTKSKYTVSLKLMEENFYKFVTDSLAVGNQ